MNLKLKIQLEKIKQEKKIKKNILFFLIILFLIILFYHLMFFINSNDVLSSNVEQTGNVLVSENNLDNDNSVVIPDNVIVNQKEIDRTKIVNDILDSNKKLSNEYANNLAYNIVNIADIEGINPYLLAAVIKTESNYNQNIKSDADAVGLGQLTEECTNEIQKRTGVYYNRYNLIENIQCCAKYLSLMTKKFHNEDLVLAAYNAGETIVAKNNSVPNISETKYYVMKVHEAMNNY